MERVLFNLQLFLTVLNNGHGFEVKQITYMLITYHLETT